MHPLLMIDTVLVSCDSGLVIGSLAGGSRAPQVGLGGRQPAAHGRTAPMGGLSGPGGAGETAPAPTSRPTSAAAGPHWEARVKQDHQGISWSLTAALSSEHWAPVPQPDPCQSDFPSEGLHVISHLSPHPTGDRSVDSPARLCKVCSPTKHLLTDVGDVGCTFPHSTTEAWRLRPPMSPTQHSASALSQAVAIPLVGRPARPAPTQPDLCAAPRRTLTKA